ncbi:MAG: hypothetical protein HOH77_14035, partial [Candidatus Latescibacteria bacterium]|nr:hypothetical protein [Candidatus Latescibacterota bacterium]
MLIRLLSLIFLFTISFSFEPINAQAQLDDAQTPCIADFEDLLVFTIPFSPLYDGSFFHIFDTNADGIINFPDFISLALSYNQHICPSLDSLVIPNQISIQHVTSDNILQNQTQINLPVIDTLRFIPPGGHSVITTPIISLETGQPSHHNHGFDRRITAGGTNIQLDITGLIADSSTFVVKHWTLGIKGAYKFPQGTITLSSPFSPAQATLSLRPFAPTDIKLFTPGVYPEASPMTPASADTLTETTARTALETFLAKRIT